jgi:hypothetical protein
MIYQIEKKYQIASMENEATNFLQQKENFVQMPGRFTVRSLDDELREWEDPAIALFFSCNRKQLYCN